MLEKTNRARAAGYFIDAEVNAAPDDADDNDQAHAAVKAQLGIGYALLAIHDQLERLGDVIEQEHLGRLS